MSENDTRPPAADPAEDHLTPAEDHLTPGGNPANGGDGNEGTPVAPTTVVENAENVNVEQPETD